MNRVINKIDLNNNSMSEKTTLKSIFAESKLDLVNKLNGLCLPKDAIKLQNLVAEYLSNLLENESGYRQSLTESEDFVLLSVIRLLQSQQNIAREIAHAAKDINNQNKEKIRDSNKSTNSYWTVAGAGAGAIVGGLLNTWGAVAGAIAGTALIVYLATKQTARSNSCVSINKNMPVNSDIFVAIVENICDNVDAVIETFRVQIKRVEKIYEQREEPRLTAEYSTLLAQVVNVYNVCSSSKDVPIQLKQAIDFMVESLENYDLKIVDGKITNC